jgi:hypothetical protein
MLRKEDLIRKVKSYDPNADLEVLERAFDSDAKVFVLTIQTLIGLHGTDTVAE